MSELLASSEAVRLRTVLHEVHRLLGDGVRPSFLQEMIADALAVDMTAPDPNLPPLTVETVQEVIDSLQNLKQSLAKPTLLEQLEAATAGNEVS